MRYLDLPPRFIGSLKSENYTLVDDPLIKYGYKPNLNVGPNQSDPTNINWKINSLGFRDGEFSETKPPKTFRIAVFGDSITAGNGISDVANIYSKKLESILNSIEKLPNVEVMNFGVGGYNTLNEAGLARLMLPRFKPDLVLIGFCLNDFEENADGGVYRSLIHKEKHQGLNLFKNFLLQHSRLFLFFFARIQRILDATVQHPSFQYENQRYETETFFEAGLKLLSLVNESAEVKKPVFIFAIPSFNWNTSGYSKLNQDLHQKAKTIAANFPTFEFHDLLNDFMANGKDGAEFAQGTDVIHPNEAGHALLAKIIAEKIKNAIRLR